MGREGEARLGRDTPAGAGEGPGTWGMGGIKVLTAEWPGPGLAPPVVIPAVVQSHRPLLLRAQAQICSSTAGCVALGRLLSHSVPLLPRL